MSTEIQKSEQITDSQLISYLDAMGLAKNLTSTEKTQYTEICKAYQLNPFKKEVHVTKYGTGEYAVFSIVVGYEVYLKRAERTQILDGWDVKHEGTLSENNMKAVITIYRKDRKFPFVHEVFYSEYVQKKKDGTVNKFWAEKPITMLKKVATAQGFRLCFPDEMGGMPYISEEVQEVQEVAHVEMASDEQKVQIINLLEATCFDPKMVSETTLWAKDKATSKQAIMAIEKLTNTISEFKAKENAV